MEEDRLKERITQIFCNIFEKITTWSVVNKDRLKFRQWGSRQEKQLLLLTKDRVTYKVTYKT